MKKITGLLLVIVICMSLLGCEQARQPVGTCTVSISAEKILGHENELKEEKRSLVPADGWILAPMETEIFEGETAFDVLQRVTREQKIHMEFTKTPLYDSVYVEGIGNFYEFDCGSGSGWMFSVNGEFPNVSASGVTANPGDSFCWSYTLDRGADLGQTWEDAA